MARVRPQSHEPKTSTWVKYSLFFLNIVFWLVGGIILAFGIMVLVETKEFYQQMADLTFQPAILFFLVGFIIFIITFIGCIGALRENSFLLATYSIILTVILLLMVGCAVVGFMYKETLENKVTSSLKKAIEYYRDEKRQDLQNMIDSAQMEFKCCGATSYDDWDANIYFNCTSEVKGPESCGVPFSCCLAELQLNRQCGYGIRKPGVTYDHKRKTIYTSGCVDQGKTWFADNLILIGSVSVAVLFLQLISIFLANKLRGEVKDIKDMRG